MTTLSTSAGTVAYDSRGSGDPVVLLPSGGHEQHDYDEIRELLPGGFRASASTGRATAGTVPFTELRLAQVIEELLESLTPCGAVLVGHSVGGNVAVRLAIRRPDLVKGLMIIGGGLEESRLPARVFCALVSRPWFTRRVYPMLSPGLRAPAHCRRPPGAGQHHRDHAHRPGGEGGHRDLAQLQPPRARPPGAGGKITAPTVLAWGRHDPILPLRAGETARDLIPGSRLVAIDSGHLPHTTSPAAVAAELTSLANTAFDGGSRVNDVQYNPPATKEQQ